MWPGDSSPRDFSPRAFNRVGFVTGLVQEARIAARLGGMVRAGGGTYEGARSAALALADHGATALVSFGIAGALDPNLRAGDIIVPWAVLISGQNVRVDTDYALSAALSRRPPPHPNPLRPWGRRGGIRRTCASPPLGAERPGEVGGTGPRPLLLGASEPAVAASEKYRLHAETGCAAVDLESGAVAEIARLRGLPFAALRAVCDPADFSLPPASLVGLTGTGEINVWPVIASLLRQPAQLPALIHLARAAAAARRALAKACGSQLPLRPRGRRGSG